MARLPRGFRSIRSVQSLYSKLDNSEEHPRTEPAGLLYPGNPDAAPGSAAEHHHTDRGAVAGLLHKHGHIELGAWVERGLGDQEVEDLVSRQLLVSAAAHRQRDPPHWSRMRGGARGGAARPARPSALPPAPHRVAHIRHNLRLLHRLPILGSKWWPPSTAK